MSMQITAKKKRKMFLAHGTKKEVFELKCVVEVVMMIEVK